MTTPTPITDAGLAELEHAYRHWENASFSEKPDLTPAVPSLVHRLRAEQARAEKAEAEVARLTEALKLASSDAGHHLRKYRPHVLNAINAALAASRPAPAQPGQSSAQPAAERDALVDQAEALLALDAKGALVPYGVCGLARQIIEKFIARLKPRRPDGFPILMIDGSVLYVEEDATPPADPAQGRQGEEAP